MDILRKLFREKLVVNMNCLFEVLETKSRMSVFRRLVELGYYSSCSHSGRYYTWKELPTFDENGLWSYRGILFSKEGTLRRTLSFKCVC